MNLVFDQSSPVQPVSEYRGGTLSVTKKKKKFEEVRKSSCLIRDVKLEKPLNTIHHLWPEFVLPHWIGIVYSKAVWLYPPTRVNLTLFTMAFA